MHQALQGICRLPLGACFQHLADRDQRRDHGRGFVVQFIVIDFHHLCGTDACSYHTGDLIEHKCTPGKCDGRTERYQRIHIRGSVEQ